MQINSALLCNGGMGILCQRVLAIESIEEELLYRLKML